MPKRPRTAHVPHQTRKRKAKRPQAQPFTAAPGARAPGPVAPMPEPEATPVRRAAEPVVGPRQGARRSAAEATRIRYGQLPTYERAYLMSEIRRIGVVSAVLFGAIVAIALAR